MLHPSVRRAVVTLALAISPTVAWAQDEADRGQARDLGTQGYAALEKGDYVTAEDLLRRAEALYHAPTILLGLARAQAHRGKFVEAWENYHRVVIEGAPANAPPAIRAAVAAAMAEIDAVAPHRGKLTVTVVGPKDAAVALDGVALPPAALGAARFVNPGKHLVHASSPGWQAGDTLVTVAEGAEATAAVELHAAPTAVPPTDAVSATFTTTPSNDSAPTPPASGSGWRTIGWVSLAAGGVGLVVGGITGALAMSNRSNAASSPCASSPCGQSDLSSYQSTLSSFHTFATTSTVGFIAGGVLAAGGAALLLTMHGDSRTSLAAYVGPSGGGLLGHF
jgi:hypothetical protein